MMKYCQFILTVSLFCFSVSTFSQSWQVSWENRLGSRKVDFFTDVIEDRNMGYTVLGSTIIPGNSSDFWLVRYNSNGDTLWTKTLGTSNKDVPKKIKQLTDGGYLLMGTTIQENISKLMLLKTDEKGNEVWRKIYSDSEYCIGEDLISLEENKFVLVGTKGIDEKNSQLWMTKMNPDGSVVWEDTFEPNLNGCIKTVKKLPDGGFAFAGQVNEAGKKDCDAIVFRTNSSGEKIWSSRIKSPGSKMWPECICCSTDSCFMLAGWKGNSLNDINSDDPIFDFDMVVNKLDCTGKVLWAKNFDREGSEGGNAIAIRPNGDFLIAGIKATSFTGKVGPWLMHLNPQGDFVDEKLIPFHFNNDHAIKVINCSDGGFVVIGPGKQDESNSRSDGWIMKFASL